MNQTSQNENTTEQSDSVIRLLPSELSNKIAAGEVVERPGAVVKELLDNAIDSGADSIKILIRQAGKAMIQVVDNGCGMSADDLKLCFTRHATSKIHQVEDLYNIRTLGFRGEAMASIAAVSQISAKTKRVQDNTGWELEIWGGEEREMAPVAAEDGTSVTVKNLFFNVPARRAFLKTDQTELRHIILAVQQAALAHPDIAFELTDGSEIIYKLPSQKLSDRIAAIFGKSYKASLIPVEEETSLFSVKGYIIDPRLTKKSRGEQFLFVNGRPFFHRHLNYVIQKIYSDWISQDQFPFYALFYEMNPGSVDVNVHPTKLEVKFEDERSISSFTRSIVKRALNERFHVPPLKPEEESEKETGFKADFSGFSQPESSLSKGFQNFDRGGYSGSRFPSGSQGGYQPQKPQTATFFSGHRQAEALYGGGDRPADRRETAGETQAPAYDKGSGFWQLHDTYILTQTLSGLLIIDQYSAHKRILFEKAVKTTESGLPSTQQLLFPQTVDFSASDYALLKEAAPTLRKMGFNIQLLSGNSAIISGVPSDVNLGHEKPFIESILHQYQSYGSSVKLSAREKLALAYASKAAIPRGKKLSNTEMEALIDQLFSCDDPFFDPQRKPIVSFSSREEIAWKFQ